MKYILMMNTMKAGEPLSGWATSDSKATGSKSDFQAHCTYLMNLNKELEASGELVSVEGLSFPDQARLVRAGIDAMPITDGVFPEGKEFLASFCIVDVDSPGRAYAIAALASAAPGPGGTPMNTPIEVRPLMSGPPADFL